MGRYRKVDVSIWGDAKFQSLTQIPPCGQGLWFYLLTNPEPHAIPGLFKSGEAGMAEALNWDLKDFRKAFQEISIKGMVKADWKARVIFIPSYLKFNRPESPNVVKGWAAHWSSIPECELKFDALKHTETALLSMSEAFQKAFKEAFAEDLTKGFPKASRKTMPNQEQEQEQEQEIKPLSSSNDKIKSSASAVGEVIACYLRHHPRARPGEKEKKAIRARLAEGYDAVTLCSAIEGCHITPHNIGANPNGTKYLQLELIMRSSSQVQRFSEAWSESMPKGQQTIWQELAATNGVVLDSATAEKIAKAMGESEERFKLAMRRFDDLSLGKEAVVERILSDAA